MENAGEKLRRELRCGTNSSHNRHHCNVVANACGESVEIFQVVARNGRARPRTKMVDSVDQDLSLMAVRNVAVSVVGSRRGRLVGCAVIA